VIDGWPINLENRIKTEEVLKIITSTRIKIMSSVSQRPSSAFIGASWVALCVGLAAFLVGLWNSQIMLNEKGFYFAILMYGLFAAVSLQKSIRDQLQGIPVTGLYFGLCWSSVGLTIVLMAVGLWNASLTLSEKGFYAMAFVLSLFAAVAIQKNVRDMAMEPEGKKVLGGDLGP